MTDLDTNEPIRGPEAVRKSLIEAAVQLMAMRSPGGSIIWNGNWDAP